MNTLPNVNNRRGGVNPPYTGLISDGILEVQTSQQSANSHTGVSSFYVPIENHQWFVLRATYNRAEKELDTLEKNVTYVYLPQCYVLKPMNGKKKRMLASFIPNLVFVYSTKEHLEQAFKEDEKLNHYHFYRDKTKGIDLFDKKHPPAVVSHDEMLNFIKLTNVKSEHVKLVKPEHCHYKSGDKVRIVDDEISSVEGRVARISGQQRAVVKMRGGYGC